MIDFYVDRVIKGKKKWTDIHKLWNNRVKDALIANGYILNEDGTVTNEEQDIAQIQ